ncbi:hypothetical protein ABL78_6095 [Leptomonas seymouri]|uniref:Uncharacterized protein n=1 Tax=Leptomonas seymouri TaxID=5684 RepID=A0A0N1HU67_LEPSE|nr:hypothetical protein ABL78_6095 [Leptomonas seymouri]|eukprot:KPI84838.1 hypothetical protein ABL78_6095 [Leptomonas seymouri]
MQQHYQHQQGALPVVIGEPQFATVTFVGEDNLPGSTFRVPLNSSTTVSRLAKDAMKRLVLSRPSEGRHLQLPAIVVTEVYVGGTDTQPKAEVFAQDIVHQVVLVREEIIYMKLRAGPSSAMSSRLPTPPPLPEATQRCSLADAAVDATASTGAPRIAAAQPKGSVRADNEVDEAPAVSRPSLTAAWPGGTNTTTQPPPAKPLGTAALVAQLTSASATEEKREVVQPAAALATAAAHPKRPGWGPEAYERFADNYVSTPGKRPRKTPRNRAAAATAAADSRDTKKMKAESKIRPAEKKATAAGSERETERGLRWGPEASKSFPDNYVSSPEKLARLARQQQRRVANKETIQSAAAPPPIVPEAKARVSRELVYPSDQPESGRTTVGHPVEGEVITVEEDSASAAPAVELPKGWGTDSLRYFDPNTYCDDPKKARLVPNMDLSRSVRQRRPASP